ncbi:MAG: hypothetical protein ACREIA_17750 [Opitutaceae bacterium]
MVFLVLVSALNYYCGEAIGTFTGSRRRRLYLVISLVASLGLLGYFKYASFAIDVTLRMLSAAGLETNPRVLDILLPVGISFYVFHGMSYTIDIYFGKLKPVESFRQFALYMAFFPLLVAGPIIRAREFLPQLRFARGK